MTDTSHVRLGQILTLNRHKVRIQPELVYRTAGIYSFGRGVFEREKIQGADTAASVLYQLRERQFIMSRLNGWEGALDVVPASIEGCLVSNEYPTFTIDENLATPEYLKWLTRWPSFWAQLLPRGSMVRRRRVQISQLLDVVIPLPSIEEQRRVAARLDHVSAVVAEVIQKADHAAKLAAAFTVSAISRPDLGSHEKMRLGWREIELSEILSPSPSTVHVDHTRNYPIAGIYSFGRGLIDRGSIPGSETAYKILTRLAMDDVVISKLGGWEGAVTVVTEDFDGHFVSPEFPTFKTNDQKVDPKFFQGITISPWFWEAISSATKGSMARRKRITSSDFLSTRIWLPPLDEQRRVASKIESASRVNSAREGNRGHLHALMPSALNDAFVAIT
ncbi:MAG TPA: hypothetical protein VGD67_07225 [Pseudonocardiaceae bacterium]